MGLRLQVVLGCSAGARGFLKSDFSVHNGSELCGSMQESHPSKSCLHRKFAAFSLDLPSQAILTCGLRTHDGKIP